MFKLTKHSADALSPFFTVLKLYAITPNRIFYEPRTVRKKSRTWFLRMRLHLELALKNTISLLSRVVLHQNK